MTTTRSRRAEISTAVRRIVLLESRLALAPDDITEAEPLNGDLLRINSLGFLGMLVRLEDDLDVTLPDNLFVNHVFTTVADLVDVVTSAVAGTPMGRVDP
jgi:acyl carrier protein